MYKVEKGKMFLSFVFVTDFMYSLECIRVVLDKRNNYESTFGKPECGKSWKVINKVAVLYFKSKV